MKLEAIYEPIKYDLQRVEKRLETIVTSEIYPVFESYNYILSSGGKRLRPALVLLSAKCLAHDSNVVIDVACAVELIHTASLIHDDIIDSADLRRGKPAAHVVWGAEIAVTIGDYLFSRAMEILAEHENCRSIRVLSRAAKRVAEGELLETANRRNVELTEEEYINIISGKTAALMSASCELAAEIASAPEPYNKALSRYGLNFGILYQIMDDLLDLLSTDGQLGKPAKNSLREGNLSLPLIHILRNSNGDLKEQLLSVLSSEEMNAAKLQQVMDIVNDSDACSRTRIIAEGYAGKARNALAVLEDSPAKQCLLSLADFVVNRPLTESSHQPAAVSML